MSLHRMGVAFLGGSVAVACAQCRTHFHAGSLGAAEHAVATYVAEHCSLQGAKSLRVPMPGTIVIRNGLISSVRGPAFRTGTVTGDIRNLPVATITDLDFLEIE